MIFFMLAAFIGGTLFAGYGILWYAERQRQKEFTGPEVFEYEATISEPDLVRDLQPDDDS